MSEPRTIVITGAGTGIGEACAERFASAGDHVVLIGRRPEPIERAAARTGGQALVGDAADSQDWARFIEQIKATTGHIDSLIACAGGHGLGTATETDDPAWSAALRANLDTAFVSARACLPHLIERRGSIVFVASIASLAAGPAVCGYTTAKHALLGLTRSLARDYGPSGVRVNAVCPGWVRTPMADQEMQAFITRYHDSMDAAYRRVCADVPLRRPAEADEIASICTFLVSPDASIITGTAIVADGGSSIVDVPTLAFDHLTAIPQA